MTIADKYDWLTEREAVPARAVHRRLGREVVIHEVALDGLDARQESAIRTTVSNLSKLDHPAIPHLVDFGQDGQSYFLAVESYREPLQLESSGFLDGLRSLEQICDALSHAADRGVAHGELTRENCCVDAQGHVKVTGLGLKQLPPSDGTSLFDADLQQMRSWIDRATTQCEQSKLHSAEELRQVADLRSLLSSFDEQKSDATIQAFHSDFRGWLDREFSRQESRKLSFDGEADEAIEEPRVLLNPLWYAVGAVSLLLIGLATWLFWPDSQESQKLTENTDSNALAVAAGDADSAKLRDASAGVPKKTARKEVFESELGNVGTLNNAAVGEVVQALESTESTEIAVPKATDDSQEMPSPVPEAEAKSEPEPEKPNASKPSPETPADPFEGLADFVSLPSVDDSDSVALLQMQLGGDANLGLQLAGGRGAYRTGEFILAKDNTSRWEVSFVQDVPIAIAQIDLLDGKLNFRWTNEATENAAIAGHLGNTALLLRRGAARHTLALREYTVRPALPVQLERKKPYDIDLPNSPEPDDIITEFVAGDGSLAQALPKSMISASEKMKIGLDAGKESLIVVSVEPKFKARKQALLIRASARIDSTSRFVAVKNGATKKLRSDVQTIARTLYQMKATKGKLKDKAKDRRELQIKQLEMEKKRLEAFVESYRAAGDSRLHFRIYRQVGPHRIPLLLFGLEP